MGNNQNTVFVLGAGFTKAFLPDAPLMVDTYDIGKVLAKFKNFERANTILNLECDENSEKKINIERLLTRIEEGTPYDSEREKDELRVLSSEIKQVFLKKITEAKKAVKHQGELHNFANYCIKNKINCITFNYDDVLDETLTDNTMEGTWNPNNGYGFFCQSSKDIANIAHYADTRPSVLTLLKLHGSMNWYIKRGYNRPYPLDAIIHYERWYPNKPISPYSASILPSEIKQHLEPDPLIIPPILSKSTLTEQPIFRLLWSKAYEELKSATKVVFIGYSLPLTDLATTFLMREALQNIDQSNIEIVNSASNNDDLFKKEIIHRYKEVFPKIDEEKQFKFNGALEWVNDFVANRSEKDQSLKQ